MGILLSIIIAAFPELVLLPLVAIIVIGGLVCIGVFLIGGAALLISGVITAIDGFIQKIKKRWK